MRKPNYHQARKQKELSRKARQQEKQQRRAVAKGPEGDGEQAGVPEESKSPDDPTPGSET